MNAVQRTIPWMLALALGTLWMGCRPGEPEGPYYPDDLDHDDATNETCAECHYEGDGDLPPSDHGDEAPDEDHEDCMHCHWPG